MAVGVEFGRRLVESKVQQVALAPDGGVFGHLGVLAAAHDLDVRLVAEVGVECAPTGKAALVRVGRDRQVLDRVGLEILLPMVGSRDPGLLGEVDGVWLLEDGVIA